MFIPQLIELGEGLSSFVVGSEGNISLRTDSGFIIKASGKTLKGMKEDSSVECDIEGVRLQNQINKPSMETSFHSWIYKNSNFKVIAHTHPTNTLKILSTDYIHEFSYERLFPDHAVFNGEEACVVPYATPGLSLTKEVCRSVNSFKERCGYFPNLLLLQNHGLICCANSVNEAIIMTEICEKAAEIFIGSKSLGSVNVLSDFDVECIINHDDEKYRKNIT